MRGHMNEKDRTENMSPANCCIKQTLADRNMSVALEYENHQFIMLVQAMLGGLHPHIAAMGMRCVDEVVQLHVVVDEKTDAVLAAVRDIQSGWRALQSAVFPVSAVC